MPVLGTAPTDPNFYSRKAAQGAETLQMIVAAVKAKEERKRQLEMSEIDRFFKMAQEMPELADTWGADIAKKYGEKYPGVAPTVQAYQQRGQIAGQIKKAGESWMEAMQQLEAGHVARQTAFGELPDTIDMPGALGPIQAPNPNKAAMQQEIAAVNPAMFPLMAMQKLKPIDRMRAKVWAKSQGIDLPSDPDLFGDDLTAQQKAVLLTQMGWLTGESAEAARNAASLRLSQADEEKQTFDKGEREARERHDTAERKAREQATEGQTKLTDRLARERQGIETRDQKSVAAYKAGLRVDDDDEDGGGKRSVLDWKAVHDDANAGVKDYDDRLKESTSKDSVEATLADYKARRSAAVGDLRYGTDEYKKAFADFKKKNGPEPNSATIRQQFAKENGKRPAPIPETHARIITKKVRVAAKKAGYSDEMQAMAVEGLVNNYRDLVAAGKTPAEALMEIFKE